MIDVTPHQAILKDREILARVFSSIAAGTPAVELARELNQEAIPRPDLGVGRISSSGWRSGFIRQLIRNPRYRGAGVDADLWDKAQVELRPRGPAPRSIKNRLMLTCGHEDNDLNCPPCRSYRSWSAGLRRYGMTADDYLAMLNRQQGVCAVCGKPETATMTRTGEVKRLAVDHSHETLKVRGLLCQRCNQALGWFESHGGDFHTYLSTVSNRNPEGFKAPAPIPAESRKPRQRRRAVMEMPKTPHEARPYGLRGDAAEKAVVRGIFKAAAEGRGTSWIAVKLNRSEFSAPGKGVGWTRDAVRRILRDQRYCQQNGTNPLVDADLWAKAQLVIRPYQRQAEL